VTLGSPVYVIAEAGVNHNGSVERAQQLIDAAVVAGADAVKFQTFVPELLVSRHGEMAQYQQRNTGESESQLAMVQKLRLDEAAHVTLKNYCEACGISFLSSPFDSQSLRFLVRELHVPRLKLGSGELTNGPFLVECAQAGLPIILSTGMADLAEVRRALSALAWGYLQPTEQPAAAGDLDDAYATPEARQLLADRVALLHCTTQYPTPLEAVNLRAMNSLHNEFGLPVGFSDHTTSTMLAAAAVAMGACIIEKHFTLDRALPGPDHKASLEPLELADMVANIRAAELALGDGAKAAQAVEVENIQVARKSLVAAVAIAKGETFTADNMTSKRPGSGLDPFRYWSLLGQIATRDYSPDDLIEADS
jgi:N-acetylneuraminate synthase